MTLTALVFILIYCDYSSKQYLRIKKVQLRTDFWAVQNENVLRVFSLSQWARSLEYLGLWYSHDVSEYDYE